LISRILDGQLEKGSDFVINNNVSKQLPDTDSDNRGFGEHDVYNEMGMSHLTNIEDKEPNEALHVPNQEYLEEQTLHCECLGQTSGLSPQDLGGPNEQEANVEGQQGRHTEALPQKTEEWQQEPEQEPEEQSRHCDRVGTRNQLEAPANHAPNAQGESLMTSTSTSSSSRPHVTVAKPQQINASRPPGCDAALRRWLDNFMNKLGRSSRVPIDKGKESSLSHTSSGSASVPMQDAPNVDDRDVCKNPDEAEVHRDEEELRDELDDIAETEIANEEPLLLPELSPVSQSIPSEHTALFAVQYEDCQHNRALRQLKIIVPEGVRADRKVRVMLNNMEWELEVPEDSQAGEEVSCELLMVMPMDSGTQRHILHQEILVSRLRYRRLPNGSWVTDEHRKKHKMDAYRTLRGRCMGLVLSPILEDEERFGDAADNGMDY